MCVVIWSYTYKLNLIEFNLKEGMAGRPGSIYIMKKMGPKIDDSGTSNERRAAEDERPSKLTEMDISVKDLNQLRTEPWKQHFSR